MKEYPNANLFCEKNRIDLTMAHDISLNKLKDKGVQKLWVGQPKDMLQVTWEQGLLDLDTFWNNTS